MTSLRSGTNYSYKVKVGNNLNLTEAQILPRYYFFTAVFLRTLLLPRPVLDDNPLSLTNGFVTELPIFLFATIFIPCNLFLRLFFAIFNGHSLFAYSCEKKNCLEPTLPMHLPI